MTSVEIMNGIDARYKSYKHHLSRLEDFVESGGHVTEIRALQGFVDIILLDCAQDIVSYTQLLTHQPMAETLKSKVRDFLKMLFEMRQVFNTYINLYVKF